MIWPVELSLKKKILDALINIHSWIWFTHHSTQHLKGPDRKDPDTVSPWCPCSLPPIGQSSSVVRESRSRSADPSAAHDMMEGCARNAASSPPPGGPQWAFYTCPASNDKPWLRPRLRSWLFISEPGRPRLALDTKIRSYHYFPVVKEVRGGWGEVFVLESVMGRLMSFANAHMGGWKWIQNILNTSQSWWIHVGFVNINVLLL